MLLNDVDGAAQARFNGFVTRRHRALIRSAFVQVGDVGRAEDLVQDALYKTFLAWDRLAAAATAESNVRTTMVRLALRRRKRRWTNEISREDLPEPTRAVLVPRFVEDLTEAETASVLRCSIGTVQSGASRALATLRSSGLLVDEEVHGG